MFHYAQVSLHVPDSAPREPEPFDSRENLFPISAVARQAKKPEGFGSAGDSVSVGIASCPGGALEREPSVRRKGCIGQNRFNRILNDDIFGAAQIGLCFVFTYAILQIERREMPCHAVGAVASSGSH